MITTTTANKTNLRKALVQAKADLTTAKKNDDQLAAKKARRQIRRINTELEFREMLCWPTKMTY